MDLVDAFDQAAQFVSVLSKQLGVTVSLPEPFVGPGPIGYPDNADLRPSGFGNASGVYFVVRPSGEIAYIGKATAGNLHVELWNKLKTPVGETKPYRYPNTIWSGGSADPEVLKELQDGVMTVAALRVEPEDWSSLLEVYLQTVCKVRDESLPALNSRIG